MDLIDAASRRRFSAPLLKWYRAVGRVLPWRETDDPYAIWLSEIMLQQTQVATAIPYYQRFLSTFPNIEALANAELQQVLKLWEGLGYYARARHLYKAAGIVMSVYSGKLPTSFEALNGLPGIGRSTAGAILSIAYKKRFPILDGNVRRVLCRFFAIEKDPREKSTEAWLWDCSEKLLPKRDANLYLQAIMDLGATVCIPKNPNCMVCPVKKSCAGYKKGLQTFLPIKPKRKKVPHYDHFAGIFICGNEVLIRRRPMTGLLAGLWEFPGERVDFAATGSIVAAYQRYFRKEMNADLQEVSASMTIRHAFTHFKMTLHVFSFHLKKQTQEHFPWKWVRCDALSSYPFSTAHQKIVSVLKESEGQREGLLLQV